MAKKISPNKINSLDADWGKDAANGLPYSGQAVQDFLKTQIKGKVSSLYRTPETLADGLYHVYGFASEDDKQTFIKDNSKTNLILSDFTIPSDNTSTKYTVDIATNSNQSGILVMGGSVKINLRFTSQYLSPGATKYADTGNSGTLTIQRRASSASQWEKVAERNIDSLPADSTSWTEIDITSLLMEGSHQFRFQVTDPGSGLSTRWLVFQNVTKTQLGLTFATQWEKPITDGVLPLAFYVQGSVNKTLHINISGGGGVRPLTYDLGTTTYTETPWTQNVGDVDSETVKVTSHGVHSIEAWLTTENGTSSEHVHGQLFVRKDGADTKTYMLINNTIENVANYTDATFFQYAVITPNGATANVHVKATDSAGKTTYSDITLANRESGKRYDYTGMLEIDSQAKTIAAYFNFTDDSGEKIADRVAIAVDNTENFAPTAGADFVLNPKMRSNEETEAKSIINDVSGEKVDSTWKGFAMSDADGWNNGALVVPAGHEVNIDYEVYSGFMGSGNHTDSLTVEMDLKVDHVSDEDATLLRVCSFGQDGKTPVGLLLKGLQMVFMTVGQNNDGSQNVMLQEGERTHVALNIVHNLGQTDVNYVRIFVKGVINREFSYEDSDTFVQYVTENGTTKQTSQGIRLGGTGADLTIYGMRIYKKALSSADVRQDSMSALPTAAEKVAFREANAITGDNGLINYTKAREKYNTLLHTGPLPSYTNQNEYSGGISLDIHIVGDQKHSGTMNNLSAKGQGSSSKGYWKWNQQYKPNDDTVFVSEDGETTIKKGYQLDDTVPVAKKLVGKLNWASSMQSHKIGGTNMYNDLWKAVVGGNSITKTAGYENCRAAVKEKPFLFFHRETENDEPVFDGMMTFGPGKADKPTFWGDEEKFPDLLMIEGSDNGRPLTLCQVPWMDDEVNYSEGDEGWKYAGNISWDNDMGNMASLHYFKDAFNQVFLHSISIMPHEGGLTALNADKTLNKAAQYWITEDEGGSKKYDLFRYDYITETWVNASAHKTGGVYDRLNINEQCGGIASGVDWEATNEQFIAKRAEWAKGADGLGKYFNVNDTLFENCLCKLIAASDNRCKNIYCYVDPVTHLICWYQDDVDTIGPIDNVGQNRKKYFLEEHDSEANGVLKSGEAGWNGGDNNLFNLLETAYRIEVRQMMNKILTAMATLCGSPEVFIQKYFFDVSEYFPAVAYNETARVLYEEAAAAKKAGKYDNATDPLSQSVGNNLECEKEWWKWRLIYMSSYCNYGQFILRGNRSLFVRSILALDGHNPEYTFRLVPAKWIYVSGFTGQALKWGKNYDQPQRAEPGKVFVLDGITGDGNTDIGICGADYFSSFGNFGNVNLGETFNLTGERLTEFVATSDGDMAFRPKAIDVSNCPVLRMFDIDGAAMVGGTLDLKQCTRLETISAKNTKITDVTLPSSPVLRTIALGADIQHLTLDGLLLEDVSLESYSSLQDLTLAKTVNAEFDAVSLIDNIRISDAQIGGVNAFGVEWNNCTAAVMDYLSSLTNCTITGTITMKSGERIAFDAKRRMLKKWGNIDDKNNTLYVSYEQTALSGVKVLGTPICMKTGMYEFVINPDIDTGNDFTKCEWSISKNSYATIDAEGVLNVTDLGTEADGSKVDVTVNVTKMDGTVLTDTMSVGVYYRNAKAGDYVFQDGSYNEGQVYGKKTIGMCFWVNEDNPDDRRMMALENMPSSYQWGIWAGMNVKFTEDDGTAFSVGNTYAVDGWQASDINLSKVLRDFGPWKAGDSVPYGMRQTLLILEYRNRVLKDAGWEIPAANGSISEMQSLWVDSNSHTDNGGHAYYYIPASYCYAYSPNVEDVDAKFGPHHWYLPTVQELIQMVNLTTLDIYKNAVTNREIKAIGSNYMWSCCENGGDNAWYVYMRNGSVDCWTKNYSRVTRAVAAF